MMLRFRKQRERGFTLIEVMAALSVFSIVTVGLVPLFASSMKGAALSRTHSVGKTLALDAMERARGVPYFMDFPTQAVYSDNPLNVRKVDLLDLYFPGQPNNAGDTYRTVCDVPSTSADPNTPCPANLPAGYTVEFIARFVEPVTATVAGKTVEQFATKPPDPAYKWNPSPYSGQDQPPSPLLELTVVSKWSFGGKPQTNRLTGIIGNRDFGVVTVAGDSHVDYLVQATTHYGAPDDLQQLTATYGAAESVIESKSISVADQVVRAAQLKLMTVPPEGTTAVDVVEPVDGATSIVHAPPDSTPGGDSVSERTITHPTVGDIAGFGGNSTDGLKVRVSQELPIAEGSFSYSVPDEDSKLFWLDSQRADDTQSVLGLDKETLWMTKRGSDLAVAGTSTATTGEVETSQRRVQTTASVSFGRLRLLGTNFISAPINDLSGPKTHDSVLVIRDFSASVDCNSTAKDATAKAEKKWSASLHLFVDDDLLGVPDDLPVGKYLEIPLGSNQSSDPLAAYGPGAGKNPLVYDAPLGQEDIYLFEDPAMNRKGYLLSWRTELGEAGDLRPGGRVTQASLDTAIRVVTAPTDPLLPESSTTINIGKLRCQSQDLR